MTDARSMAYLLLTPIFIAWHDGIPGTMVESWICKHRIREEMMSHRRKKYLSAGLAGVLCSTALVGLTMAQPADGKNNLNLPGLRERQPTPNNSFTRMFPDLPPFAKPTDAVRQQAQKMGEKGGPCDPLDNLTDPIKSITEPNIFSPNNPDNPNMTAGVTFFGQFLDHDITLDPRSPLFVQSDPKRTTNFRYW